MSQKNLETIIGALHVLREEREKYGTSSKELFYDNLRKRMRDENLFMEIISIFSLDYINANQTVCEVNKNLKMVLIGRDSLKMSIRLNFEVLQGGQGGNLNQTIRFGYRFELGSPTFLSSMLYSYPFRYNQTAYVKLDFFRTTHDLNISSDKFVNTDVFSNICYVLSRFLENREKASGQGGFGIRSFHGLSVKEFPEEMYLPFTEFLEVFDSVYEVLEPTE